MSRAGGCLTNSSDDTGDFGRSELGGPAGLDGQGGFPIGAHVLPGGNDGCRVLGPVRAAAGSAGGDDAGAVCRPFGCLSRGNR